MLKIHFDPFPELKTERLVLRRIIPSDAHDLYVLRSNDQVMEYLCMPLAESKLQMSQKISSLDNELVKGTCIQWAICTLDDSRLIGTICIWNISQMHHRGELGYMLLPTYHQKGLMMEAIKAVIDYGFNKLQLHSLEAQVTPENIPSIKILERSGFSREGYFKENFHFEGKFLDTAIYSLLRSNKE